MIRDGRSVPNGATLDFDVCLIGAGPVGTVLAEQLSAKGFRVGVLESGGETPDASTRRLSRGRRSGLPYFRFEATRERAIGGTSWRWGSHWPAEGGIRTRRLDHLDFEARSHVPMSSWPITPEELDPWFDMAEQRCGIVPEADALEPPLELGDGVQTVWCTFADPANFRIAKDLSLVTVLSHAVAIRMDTGADGRSVESIRVGIPAGGWFTVTARTFVLASGGIENARLLLAADFGKPGGVANPVDQVGRYFMEHLHVESGELRLAQGSSLPLARYSRHGTSGLPRIGAFQISAASQSAHGLLNSTVELRSRNPRFFSPGVRSLAEIAWAVRERQRPPNLAGHVRNIAGHPRDVAVAVAARLGSKDGLNGSAHALVLTSEQAPNPASRITLAAKRDEFGVPVPHLHWQLSALDTRSIRGTLDLLDSALRSSGHGRIANKWGDSRPEPYVHGCNHHIGTTRMSPDATTGVVDPDCRVHGLTNLFVAGSSVMPTAGAITVTLAAMALAFRLAAHLSQQAASATVVA